MANLHHYKATTNWVGNRGTGTSDYRAYDRNHDISMGGKPDLLCSSDATFRGDKKRHSPEDLLVASLSGCHMLWYLHLCAANGVVVLQYSDEASGTMRENPDGSGEFTEVILNPRVTVAEKTMLDKANQLHHKAHELCFIARSVNFPVTHKPIAVVSSITV
jgi:organic hydroperoxide reductase OsmC/OhrA